MAFVPRVCLCPGQLLGRLPSQCRLVSESPLRRREVPDAPTEAEWRSCACQSRCSDRSSPKHVGSARQEGTSARRIATTLKSLVTHCHVSLDRAAMEQVPEK